MREISFEDLVPNTLYYIQREDDLLHSNGNGKQKGIFVKHRILPFVMNEYNDSNIAVFKYVTDVVGISGHSSSYKECVYFINADLCSFYLPEKEHIYNRITNNVLRQITGDPYFTF